MFLVPNNHNQVVQKHTVDIHKLIKLSLTQQKNLAAATGTCKATHQLAAGEQTAALNTITAAALQQV